MIIKGTKKDWFGIILIVLMILLVVAIMVMIAFSNTAKWMKCCTEKEGTLEWGKCLLKEGEGYIAYRVDVAKGCRLIR